MSLLIKLMHRRIGLVLLPVGGSIFAISVTLWWNMQIGSIINTINSGDTATAGSILTAAATMLLSAAAACLLSICSGWTCETLAHDLRMGYARYFSALSLTEIENINVGEQLSKLQNEIVEVTNFLRSNFYSFIDDLVRFSGTLTFLLILDPKLTLLANAPVIIIICYTGFSSRIIGEAALICQQANGQTNGFTETLISVFPVMRLFDAASLIREKYDAALKKWENAGIKEESRRAVLMSLSAILTCIPLLLLFLIGGSQVIRGTALIGTLYIFINLSGNVSGVMMNMPGRIAVFRRFSVNMKRLEPFILMQ